MYYILHGTDDYSIARELDTIKKTAGDPSLLATNTSTFDGAQVALDEFRVACETVPFLAEKRLVIVYGLVERFMPKPPPRGTGGKKTESQPGNYEPFASVINNIPPSTILLLIESELKESNPLFRMVKNSGEVRSFPPLKLLDLRLWVSRQVTEEGGSISDRAVTLLTRLIGPNLWIMSSELKKLAAYADGRSIEETDVRKTVSYTQQTNVFGMVDAIVEFNLQKAETVLQQLLNGGTAPLSLLAMLNRQMRLIVRARELKLKKLNENEMRSKLGLADWQVRKTLEQASRYTLPRLKQVYQQLLDTDLAIKTGKYDSELALYILIAELCQPQKTEGRQSQMQGVAV
ncbi:MAG: DNA polymerase III subunit delta [Dehalococcoidia bacterium]|nr:DNA polymerase III subunit delta [Dehalococcoidia bacterium]